MTLHFGGVYSGFYVWVNGALAGYAEDSCLPSEFDITGLLQPGENRLAVQVFKWTDGSYLEDADHWRMAGIHREVFLSAKPDAAIAISASGRSSTPTCATRCCKSVRQ